MREPARSLGASPLAGEPLPGLGPLRVARRGFGVAYFAVRAILRRRPRTSDVQARLHESVGHLHWTTQRLLLLHGVQLDVVGDLPEAPVILTSNHVSYLDPILITAVCPCLPIAKADVLSWPLIGPGMQSMGVLFVDRRRKGAGASPARAARTALDAGVSVVNFAEGTTTDGSRLARFQVGLFRLARKLNVPIVPLHVGYEEPSMAWVGDATFVPHYARFARRARTRARLTFCRPIAPGTADTAAELSELTRQTIADVAGISLGTVT